jgi:glycosyltransferase involved in cell wall biosynthesis
MKLALVYSFKESDWFSVTKILNNLISSYELAYGKENIIHIDLPWDCNADDVDKSKSDLLAAQCDKVVFLDHRPHPILLLKELKKEVIDSFQEIVVHVYGDFTLTFKEWAMFDRVMSGSKVKLICASDKEVDLVKNVSNQEDSLFKCPFPVKDEEFYYDQSKKAEIRKQYDIDENDIVFLYVGRLSKQKRNLETIKAFLDLRQSGELDKSHKFLVAGGFDLLGQPYFDERQLIGEYFRRIMQVIEGYPDEIRESVQLIGSIKNTTLIDYYNASDFFLSMSTYHDEDYGMAVAESLCCGLPAIITDWAGYSSFHLKDESKATHMVDVKLSPKIAEVNFEKLSQILKSAKSLKLDSRAREEVSKVYHSHFTITAAAKILKEIHDSEEVIFKGFSELLHRLAYISIFKKTPFMNEFDKTYNKFYYEIYESYVR